MLGPSDSRPAAPRRGRPWLAFLPAALLAAAPAAAKTCTVELLEKDFAGHEANEVICGTVAVRLMPLQSEMFYRRWRGAIVVRSIEKESEAKVAIAAFDAAGDLVGTHTLYAREIKRRPKSHPLRMEGMFTSLADARRILLSVSLPSGKDGGR